MIAGAIKTMAGAEAVRFAVAGDVMAERCLIDEIWHTVAGEARPILRLPVNQAESSAHDGWEKQVG